MLKIFKNVDSNAHTYAGQEISAGNSYTLQPTEESRWANDDDVLSDIGKGILVLNNGENDITSIAQAINFLKGTTVPNPKMPDDRDIVTVNRIPLGFTVYPTGAGDNIANGTYGNGPNLKTDGSNPGTSNKVTFQMLGHWYGIGGRVIWESACLDDSMSATLVAPATTGATQQAGNFDKYEIIPNSGLHIFIPSVPGAGSWDLNLSSKLTGTQILKCTPVPTPGNVGFFDYDSDTNTLTFNASRKGGYDLYDFDVSLFKFANKCWGRKSDGAESTLETNDVVGKLLYNSWQIRFTLDAVTTGVKCGIIITTAVNKNL